MAFLLLVLGGSSYQVLLNDNELGMTMNHTKLCGGRHNLQLMVRPLVTPVLFCSESCWLGAAAFLFLW